MVSTPNVPRALVESGAALIRTGDVGRGLSLAEWRNHDSYARYDRPDHHTLSLYLEGGEGVTREDGRVSGGGPDKLCLLPAGHQSRWRIDGPLRMVHLYIAPDTLAYQAMTSLDIDPGRIDLMDRTFSDDPSTTMIFRGGVLPLDWADASDRLALNSACHLLIHRLLRNYRRDAGDRIATGGLRPSARRRVAEYVDAHLDQALTLDRLADRVGLSTFHFAKVFRESFGLTPHRYVTERRISRAKLLLGTSRQRLADIAIDCGFSSQSHFTRAFRQATGATPATWRNAV